MLARNRLMLMELMLYWMLFFCIYGQIIPQFNKKNMKSNFKITPIQPAATTTVLTTQATETETVGDSYEQMQLEMRERRKQERLLFIQAQILHRLGLQNKPNITSPMLSEEAKTKLIEIFNKNAMNGFNSGFEGFLTTTTASYFTTRFQSFYPSCTIPRGIPKDEWEKRHLFRIYFDLSSTNISMVESTAKLRLYKYKQEISTTTVPTLTTPTTTKAHSNDKHFEKVKEDSGSQAFENEKIIVSIFQCLKSSRSNKRLKKKLVDSQVVNLDYKGWIELNVTLPVKEWLQYSYKNFGLELRVDNSAGEIENAKNYFTPMNCSDHDVPFPTFIVEEASGFGDNDSLIIANENYPTLDLITMESTIGHHFFRIKRENLCSIPNKRKNNCCTESMYFSFKELGWHKWIIAPEGFYTNYCVGACKSYKKSLLNSVLPKNPFTTYSENSGCLPRTYRPLHVVYIDENEQPRMAKLDDIIVSKCDCAI